MIEVTAVAYKFRAIKDGKIHEFLTLRDIPLDDAQRKIADFLDCFRILSIRKEAAILSNTEIVSEVFSTAKDRWMYIPELAKTFPDGFTRKEYFNFMTSKDLKFKSENRAKDDLQTLKKWGLAECDDNKWKFIVSEEDIMAVTEKQKSEIDKITLGSIPKPIERCHMMYKNMADKEYFTIKDWVEFMATSPNNYDKIRIRNNFYHDIDDLLKTSRAQEIKTDSGHGYSPKRYKILNVEPQAVEERIIKDIKNGQKALLAE